MKAIRMHSKGGPELLVYEDAPKPQLQPGDALVRVFRIIHHQNRTHLV